MRSAIPARRPASLNLTPPPPLPALGLQALREPRTASDGVRWSDSAPRPRHGIASASQVSPPIPTRSPGPRSRATRMDLAFSIARHLHPARVTAALPRLRAHE